MRKITTSLFLALLILAGIPGIPCTTFVLKDGKQLVFGRNFDFNFGDGYITINPRGMVKQAFLQPGENPAQWVSKYGSISFNQIGQEFPMDGMNEKGLVVAQMYLQEASYPEKDERQAVSELQWIQYHLDNSATVDEVLAANKTIRISNTSVAPLHYLVSDARGNVAVVEFLEGKFIVHKNDDIAYNLVSNLPYETSQQLLKNYAGFGGEKTVPEKSHSLEEVVAVGTHMVKSYTGQDDIHKYAFSVLEAVSDDSRTQWSIVYDPVNLGIRFKTLDNKTIRSLDFVNFDFSCTNPPLILDALQHNVGSLHTQFTEATHDVKQEYLSRIMKLYSQIPGFPPGMEQMVEPQMQYYHSIRCKE